MIKQPKNSQMNQIKRNNTSYIIVYIIAKMIEQQKILRKISNFQRTMCTNITTKSFTINVSYFDKLINVLPKLKYQKKRM